MSHPTGPSASADLLASQQGADHPAVEQAPQCAQQDKGRADRRQGGLTLVDAGARLDFGNGTELSVWGRNLTDEDGYTHGYDVAGLWSYAATRPPRTYGFEVVYNFGE